MVVLMFPVYDVICLNDMVVSIGKTHVELLQVKSLLSFQKAHQRDLFISFENQIYMVRSAVSDWGSESAVSD